MDQDPSPASQAASREIWNQARRKAFWQRLSRVLGFSKSPPTLLSFEDVQRKLRLTQNEYRGLQQVPLEKIVGSVGRYQDFSRTFLPLTESDRDRWQRVAELQIESGLPPVELYKVGDAYFVRDGNHRVSVARQLGMKTIEAYVWEYPTPTGGISAEVDVNELIVKAEYRAFLDRTRLDISRPEAQIILTEPGMYPALELEIELYRENLERIDGEPRTYEEAAAAWYDMVYSLAVDVIRESGVLELFPGRTEGDLYVWVSRHRKELAERYGASVSLKDAVEKLAEEQRRPGAVERVVQSAARSVAGLVHSLTGNERHEQHPITATGEFPPPREDEPFGKLLAQMHAYEQQMAYRGQRGEEWRAWRAALRQKIAELLDLRFPDGAPVPAQEMETERLEGVTRQKLLLEAADGLQLPAYLCRPAEAEGPLPALLVYAGHGTIRQTVGLLESPHRANALNLARAGFLTLTVEIRGFGELGQVDHRKLDSVARLMGRTWLSSVLEDGLRALDYLQARPDVWPEHLGATGWRLGGGLALYTAALDERVRAVVLQHYLGGGIDPVAVRGHGCDFVPSLWRYAQFSDVARLVVPRPMLYVYPRELETTAVARTWFDQTRPMYETFRCPDRTNFITFEGDAVFQNESAARWFARWLVEEEDTGVLLWAPQE